MKDSIDFKNALPPASSSVTLLPSMSKEEYINSI